MAYLLKFSRNSEQFVKSWICENVSVVKMFVVKLYELNLEVKRFFQKLQVFKRILRTLFLFLCFILEIIKKTGKI